MASNTIYFENPISGQTREAPIGFSWTTFWFGPFPMLFRSSWKWALILFLLAMITWAMSNIVFAFFINKLYVKDLIAEGYKARGAITGNVEEISRVMDIHIPKL